MSLCHRAMERFLSTRAGGWFALNVMNPLDKRLMRWSKGKWNTAIGTGVRDYTVLLRCTGAKSGKMRDIPLLATPFDDGWALIASATGVEKNPAWYHNLKAHPECSLVVPNRGECGVLRMKLKAPSGSARGRPQIASTRGTRCIRGEPIVVYR
jgi:deazaflavin-dependent oxidoreductase (nitroreductase family)